MLNRMSKVTVVDEATFSNMSRLLGKNYRAGLAIKAVTNALVEVTSAHENGEEMPYLKIADSSFLFEAVSLLAEQVEKDSESAVECMGCESPERYLFNQEGV